MVKRLVLAALIAALVATALSCGGSNGEDKGPSGRLPSPRPSATRPPGAGPSISVDPKSAPPGSEVTILGVGWPPGAPITVIGDVLTEGPAPGTVVNPKPYATTTAGADGSFVVSFRLEQSPSGGELKVGRIDLIARSPNAEAKVPFLVETRRPIGGPISGG